MSEPVERIPSYYRLRLPELGPDGLPTGKWFSTDVTAVIEAADLNHSAGEVVAKLIRYAKKPGSDLARERDKVVEHAQRWARDMAARSRSGIPLADGNRVRIGKNTFKRTT